MIGWLGNTAARSHVISTWLRFSKKIYDRKFTAAAVKGCD